LQPPSFSPDQLLVVLFIAAVIIASILYRLIAM
jgi:hypothetical protein